MMRTLLIAIACLTLAGCQTAEEIYQMNLQQDIATCSNMGAEYSSPAHYQCMMIQQNRRDVQAAYNNAMMQYNINRALAAF